MSARRMTAILIASVVLAMPALARAQVCGSTFPQCDGTCPPSAPVCVDTGAGCACVVDVPALSGWGVSGMAVVLIGAFWLGRRRRSPLV